MRLDGSKVGEIHSNSSDSTVVLHDAPYRTLAPVRVVSNTYEAPSYIREYGTATIELYVPVF